MNLLNKLLLRTGTVDDLLKVFDKTQARLVALSAKLRELAAKEEAEAQRKLDAAKAKSAEAERATSVANKIADLIK